MKPNIVALTGAGISAESGLPTFRGSDGLWAGHNVHEIATPGGWKRNRQLVLDFYNERRRQLLLAHPNQAHIELARLETQFEVTIVTQNVDDLHERAGSSDIIHLHGELLKVRSTHNSDLVYDWRGDLKIGDCAADGAQLRPHIVWFGEAVPVFEQAVEAVANAGAMLVAGTSLQVYPAASLLQFAGHEVPIIYIDPDPAISESNRIRLIREPATSGVRKAIEVLREYFEC